MNLVLSSPSVTLPVFKWPGGKRLLIPELKAVLPNSFNSYYEPFAGGAALFFALSPKAAHLSDKNADLTNCYRIIRDHPEPLIEKLSGIANSEEEYYRIRSSRPTNNLDRAVRFLYLCNLSFNGIYRQNFKGEFNVPYGYRTERQTCDPGRIRSASEILQNASLATTDFSRCVKTANADDIVYFDPPYTVAHNHNGFIKYNAKIFSWRDQERLSKCANELVDRGVHVVVSNADHPSIRKLYSKFKVKKVKRASVIAASDKFRGNTTEYIFYM